MTLHRALYTLLRDNARTNVQRKTVNNDVEMLTQSSLTVKDLLQSLLDDT